MIGAIIGDVIGSRFEFNNIKTKEFELFAKESRFTDDTVLTIAVADWVLHAKDLSDDLEAARYLQKWATRYPRAGFGGMFRKWMYFDDPKPYNSCGNGSAMRISPVPYLFDDEEEMLKACRTITAVTHNHPEGMKGAEVVAEMIFKAKNGATKEELKEYAISQYPEIRHLDYDELVRTYTHGTEICQLSVPQAIFCFLISKDFEDCIRTIMSIGGDCDTTGAMAGAIAEAYYNEIPKNIIDETIKRLPEDMQIVLNEEYGNKLIR